MVKGGKVSSKRRVKPRIRSDYKGSDDSDEDYVVSDEEKLVSEDLEEDYCSSLDASDDEEEEEEEVEVRWARKNSRSRGKKGVDRFIEEGEEEEDEEELEKVRKNGRSRAKKGTDRFIADEEEEDELEELEEEEDEEEMKKVKKNGSSRARKGKDRYIVDEEEDELEELEKEEEEEGEEEEEEEEAMKEVRKVARSKSQNGLSGRQKNGVKPSQKRRTKSEEMADQDYEEEEEEDDDDDDDDDDEYDEEFTPDEDDYSELEEASRVKKRKTNLKVSKRRLKKKGPIRRKSKKPSRNKQKKTRTLRRKVRSDDDDGDFMDSNLPPVREKNGKKRPKKRRRYIAQSDSDFVSAGSSDCDYTISEEEREQVREAMQLCGSIEPNLRLSDKIQDIEIVQPPRKPPGRKGKEKIEQVKVEVVKQVCGICLSEEDKRRVRGTLDCCTHYFCFSCIMEWGKVESRCPLCKQRFKTISKPTRAGTDLRDVCVTVPERDQVYQPTEEELRSYLDPYENVICTECHEGGDDGLMLLCDLCDSPAHTYCVGLGQEVPEGNWYCDGCRPVALGSSSSQVQSWFTEQRTTNNILPNRHSPAISFGEGLEIDLNSLSSPRSYITQGFGTSSPWYHVGGFQAASPGSGAGAPTLSGRRLMHRHIQQLISANRMNYLASRNERNSPANLSTDTLNAQSAQGRETIVHHARTDGTGRSFHTFFEERLQENPSLQVQDNDVFSSTSSHHRRQVVQDPTTTSADRPSNGTLWPGLTENTISGHVQTHQFSSRPNIGFDGDLSPNAGTGPSDIHRGKEQVQTLVISYIKDLSREKDLGQSTTAFQEIARSAMQTVLAACELEHLGNDVIPVQPPSPCSHIELMAGKTSLIKGCCSSCFAQFIEDVVKLVMEHKQASWLTLGL